MFYIGPPIRKVEFIYGENLREQAQKSNTPPLVSGNFFAFFEKKSVENTLFFATSYTYSVKKAYYTGVLYHSCHRIATHILLLNL